MPNSSTQSQRIQVLEVLGNAIVGGMETYVIRLIERLPPERFGITVMCPYESALSDQIRGMGLDVLITPMPDNPPWSGIQMTSALIKAQAIDVVHAHLPNAHLLAGLAGKLTGKPVLSTIHGRQLTTLDLEVHRAASTHLSVVCRQTYFHALGLGVIPTQLHFIPNGVDTDEFVPRRVGHGPLRQALGLGPEVPLVALVGRLSPEKGPDIFLRVALAVRQLAPHAHFLLIGDGPMRDDLQELINRFGLDEKVHMMGLMADMAQAYAELDVVVSTSRSEAMPLALMEAMSCGLPVVATRVGGVPDIVQHGLTGWLVGDGDFEAVARHVVQLLGHSESRLLMGQRARLRAVERLSLNASVNATMQLLARLGQSPSETRRVSAVLSGAKAASA